ncbi:MAG: DUF1365 domain-containing protein [Pseudomonadota bacterium]
MQLCFGRVRHKRLRPVLNAFEYGVYFLRLPLRAMANERTATKSSHWFSRNRFNLLAFYDSDHGDGEQNLLAWIDGLLKQEGIADADGEIWLQAFPRVLGYVFNPVSFWFCHRADGALRAVVCDVRNTFGERHCYLLDTGGAIAAGTELSAAKVFHVSPFCPLTGSYRFRFLDANRQCGERLAESHLARIDYDDGDGPLLLTSVSGQAQPISNRSVLMAFFTYPLMTFGVIAKIHWQALKLWLRRVTFFTKPTPPQEKVSR